MKIYLIISESSALGEPGRLGERLNLLVAMDDSNIVLLHKRN